MRNTVPFDLVERVYSNVEYREPLQFLAQVKRRFINNVEIYDEFMETFHSYYTNTIDAVSLVTRVARLFRGHPDLVAEFSVFLPPDYQRILADLMQL